MLLKIFLSCTYFVITVWSKYVVPNCFLCRHCSESFYAILQFNSIFVYVAVHLNVPTYIPGIYWSRFRENVLVLERTSILRRRDAGWRQSERVVSHGLIPETGCLSSTSHSFHTVQCAQFGLLHRRIIIIFFSIGCTFVFYNYSNGKKSRNLRIRCEVNLNNGVLRG